MEINQAKPTDFIEILFLLKVCIREMNAKGYIYWNSCCPSTDSIQSDLDKGFIYLIKDKGVCKGMITLKEKEPDDYKGVSFSSSSQKPLYLQNLAVHPNWQGQGIASQMVEFAQKFAREKGFDCIRLDVFQPGAEAKALYEKQLFSQVATYHSASQKIPFVCYEKQL